MDHNFFFSLKDKQIMTAIDRAIIHIVLIIAILFLFTKLSLDAIILGAIAMFFYQSRPVVKEGR